MVKVIYCMRRKAGLSPRQFLAHWEGVHAPIVLANLQALRLVRYVRTVPLAHAFGGRVERAGVLQPPYDGVAQLTWATEQDMRHAFESAEALAVQRLLAKDEAMFVDHAGSSRWIAQDVVEVGTP